MLDIDDSCSVSASFLTHFRTYFRDVNCVEDRDIIVVE